MNIYVKEVSSPSRYQTVGDWFWKDDTLCIEVVDGGDERSNLLVALHEIIEAMLCRWMNILETDVTKFDVEYMEDGEPGDSPDSPYHWPHQVATLVERFACFLIGYDWGHHDRRCDDALKRTEDSKASFS